MSGEKKSLSWTQHSTGCTLTHTLKHSLTRRPLWSARSQIWVNEQVGIGWVWNISDYIQMVHTQNAETQLPQQNEHMKNAQYTHRNGWQIKGKSNIKSAIKLLAPPWTPRAVSVLLSRDSLGLLNLLEGWNTLSFGDLGIVMESVV